MKTFEIYLHADGRRCTKVDSVSAWMYRVGSTNLESVGISHKPYLEICDREHPESA